MALRIGIYLDDETAGLIPAAQRSQYISRIVKRQHARVFESVAVLQTAGWSAEDVLDNLDTLTDRQASWKRLHFPDIETQALLAMNEEYRAPGSTLIEEILADWPNPEAAEVVEDPEPADDVEEYEDDDATALTDDGDPVDFVSDDDGDIDFERDAPVAAAG